MSEPEHVAKVRSFLVALNKIKAETGMYINSCGDCQSMWINEGDNFLAVNVAHSPIDLEELNPDESNIDNIHITIREGDYIATCYKDVKIRV